MACDSPCHAHRPLDPAAANQRRLALVLLLSLLYLFAEVIGGWVTNSLALLADAGHLLSDVAALGLSLFAVWIARRPATPRRTFGYYRAEILAALANGSTLIAIAIVIFIEAYRRLRQPPEVQGMLVMVIAVGGLAVNLAGLWILSGDRDGNLNIRGAWLHVLTDALGSVGVIVAGLLVWTCGWYWADPVASALIGLLVIYSSWMLVAEAVAVLMEMAPRGIDPDQIRNAIMAVPGVIELHDLHVWSITSGMESLSAHVVIDDHQAHHVLLAHLREVLHEAFRIDHITIQIEPADFPERSCPV